MIWEGFSDCRLEKKGCGWLGRLAGVEIFFLGEVFSAVFLVGCGFVKSWRGEGIDVLCIG